MAETELTNLQDAFIILHGFGIELSLAIVLLLGLFLAVFWTFSLRKND